jgi:hypothetical protein
MVKELNVAPRSLSKDLIRRIEDKYCMQYVCESGKDLSMDITVPMAIFYSTKKHTDGSNYMGLYRSGDQFMVTDGLPAIKNGLVGVLFSDGKYYHSTHRHDYFTDPDQPSTFIDGGRAYTRACGRTCNFVVVDGKIISKEDT